MFVPCYHFPLFLNQQIAGQLLTLQCMSQTGKAVVEVKGETKKFVMSKDGIEVVVALRALCGLESIELNTSAVWITIHQAENVLWDQELAALQKAA